MNLIVPGQNIRSCSARNRFDPDAGLGSSGNDQWVSPVMNHYWLPITIRSSLQHASPVLTIHDTPSFVETIAYYSNTVVNPKDDTSPLPEKKHGVSMN